MKRADLIRRLEESGSRFVWHCGKHDWYEAGETRVAQLVPRHRNIDEMLVKHIVKRL